MILYDDWMVREMSYNEWIGIKTTDGFENFVNIRNIAYVGASPISGKLNIFFANGRPSNIEVDGTFQELVDKIDMASSGRHESSYY